MGEARGTVEEDEEEEEEDRVEALAAAAAPVTGRLDAGAAAAECGCLLWSLVCKLRKSQAHKRVST